MVRKRRRDIIKGIGTAGIVGLAGCADSTSDDGTTDGGDGESDDGTDGTGGDGTDGTGGDGESDDGTGGDGGDAGRSINLGMLMGVTGGLEELGPPIRDAAKLVPEQINNADTDFGVDVQFEDTGTDATQGNSGAESLVNAGYPMICGALASDVSLSVARSVAIPNEIPMCSPASTAEGYSQLDGDFNFRTAVPDSLQGIVMARIAAERLGHSSAAVLAQDDAYGRGLADAFASNFEDEHGGTVTDNVIFTRGESSYTSQLDTALQGDPDMLMIVAFPEDGVQIFRDFYNGFDRGDMDIIASDGLQDPSLPDNVGFDMTNVTGTAPVVEGPGVDFFESFFEETYGKPPEGPFLRQAYDAAASLVLANAAAGENDGVAVRDNIRAVTDPGGEVIQPSDLPQGVEMAANGEDITYKGVSGETTFDENGDPGSAAYEYYEFTSDGIDQIEIITL